MLKVIAIMALGIVVGFLLRRRERLIKLNDRLTMMAIYALLFLLGLSIGANRHIVGSLHTLGLEALGIALASVFGSVVLAWMAYRLWFAHKKGGR